jgi:hypothetical protein
MKPKKVKFKTLPIRIPRQCRRRKFSPDLCWHRQAEKCPQFYHTITKVSYHFTTKWYNVNWFLVKCFNSYRLSNENKSKINF